MPPVRSNSAKSVTRPDPQIPCGGPPPITEYCQRPLPFLETLFKRDPFEERPLIWKAYVLQHAGRLEEAEEAARAAIAIDPSDGEMKHGRRMRVYAVLADIREARGDKEQARFFRGVIQAIRMSENGHQ